MTTLEALRDATARLIAENPVQIVIHRVEYVENDDGGRVKQESDLPAFTGRLALSRQQAVQHYQNEAGGLQVSAWTLIAPWGAADLKAGSDVEDTFAVSVRTYRVTRVVPRAYQDDVYAVHASVEEVS